jgi:hypothetical protein
MAENLPTGFQLMVYILTSTQWHPRNISFILTAVQSIAEDKNV